MLVLSTGGTISSRRDEGGGYVASDEADVLVSHMLAVTRGSSPLNDVRIKSRDVMRVGSYLLTPGDMVEIARRIREGLVCADVAGVVVTHGTDMLEETAFLADLVHADRRPVVFTGAQRTADAPDADGPRNLTDAITVAASDGAQGYGVLVVFNGEIFAAAGTRKTQTLALNAFSSSVSGPLGSVRNGSAVFHVTPLRPDPLDLDSLNLTGVQVDVVSYYPGALTVALRAVTKENGGARGVILEATGTGNANPDFCAEVDRLTQAGVVVGLSTRVDSGPVTPIYGAGGGIDLVAAGAIPVGTLRPPQARMLLLALLAAAPAEKAAEWVRRELARRTR